MTTDEKLHLLIQRVADLQAQCAALDYFTCILVPVLLNVLPEEKALEILALARRDATIKTNVERGRDDQGDMKIMERKVMEAVHRLIDQAERRCRVKDVDAIGLGRPLRH